jgi:hypothetical protein
MLAGRMAEGRRIPSWFDFLRLETELAMTFGSAKVNSIAENATRALGNARKALAKIQECLETPEAHGLSEEDVAFLEKRCIEIDLAFRAVSGSV